MGLLYLYCTDVCERPDSPSGCFTGYLFDKGRSGAHSRSVYCLALASRRTVLPWPVAILSCPGQSPYCLALASRHTVLPWPVAIQPTEPPRRVLFDERQASDMRFGNCWGWDSSTYGRQMWHTVVWQVEALRYKPEGRGFDSRWCH